MKIKELQRGRAMGIDLLLTGIAEKKTKSGKTYCTLKMTDGDQTILANMWDTRERSIARLRNKVVNASVRAELYMGSTTYVALSLEETAHDPAEFVRKAPMDAEIMFKEIVRVVENRTETDLASFTVNLLNANRDAFMRSAAAKEIHHAYLGGLLHHTYRMVQLADHSADIYGGLDAELLICGTALHDIGKLNELETSSQGATEYTKEGQLLGHIISGIEMIDRFAYEHGKAGKLLLLKHMIASHHGIGEYGSPVVPKCPEAMVLHHIDMIDSRVQQTEEEYLQTEAGEFSPNKRFGLDNIYVYRTK